MTSDSTSVFSGVLVQALRENGKQGLRAVGKRKKNIEKRQQDITQKYKRNEE